MGYRQPDREDPQDGLQLLHPALQLLVEPADFCFRPPAGGDVLCDNGRTEHLARSIPLGRNAEGNLDPLPLLVDPNRLVAFDPLSSPEPLHHPRQLVGLIGWDKDGDGPADDLLGGVAVEPLGPAVPTGDEAVQVLAVDGVLGRLDDHRQLASGRFRLPPLRDVTEDEDHAPQHSPGVTDRGGAVVNGAFRSVLGDEDRVVRQPDDPALPQHFLDGVLDRLAGMLVHDAEYFFERSPRPLLLRPAGQGHGDFVQRCDPAFAVGRDDGIAHAGERHPEKFLPLLGAALSKPHRLPEADDEGASEQVKGEADVMVRVQEGERVTGFHEEVVARQVAEGGGDKGGPVAPVPDGGGDGSVQRDERQVVAQPRVEQPAEKHDRRHHCDSDDVADHR